MCHAPVTEPRFGIIPFANDLGLEPPLLLAPSFLIVAERRDIPVALILFLTLLVGEEQHDQEQSTENEYPHE